MNKNTDNTIQAVPLNDKDLDQVNGGMKIIVNNKKNFLKPILDLIYKIKNKRKWCERVFIVVPRERRRSRQIASNAAIWASLQAPLREGAPMTSEARGAILRSKIRHATRVGFFKEIINMCTHVHDRIATVE